MRALLRNQNFRSTIAAIIAIAVYQTMSALTGFGAWINANSTATTVIRVLGVLLFGVLGLFGLFAGYYDPEMKPLGYRLLGILFLLIAALHATILFGDPLHILSE